MEKEDTPPPHTETSYFMELTRVEDQNEDGSGGWI
jgi:hypothetical protein